MGRQNFISVISMTDNTISLQQTLQGRIDNKTKPIGALGRLEELALQIGLIQGTAQPRLDHPHIVVFAGDHGIAATGLVNPYPQAVTAQMVLNFIHGGAAINVLCRQHGIGLKVVDAGVNFDFSGILQGEDSSLIHEKIGHGTRNYLEGDAMSREEVMRAMAAGGKIVKHLQQTGCNCIGLGEMGIGNTSSASLIMSFITGIPVEECCGRGTGVHDQQLEIKMTTLRSAHRLHLPAIAASPDAATILQHVGGFEIAMMTGAYLQAGAEKMVILIDGFITTAALLLATLLDPKIKDHCVFSHTSGERGHQRMLEFLDARPLLNLDMRLGEGTGAAMAYPILQSSMAFLREMASFESAGVSKSE
jgi:nicotinate-nucleotide--dimethylbenzimidazole phosphoribosyltransferase